MTRMLGSLGDRTTGQAPLAPATAPPAPAPPSLADAAPLQPHEVFGFAPYWTLDQSAGFDVNGLTTIAYFSIGVNPDGTLDQSGPGWAGYESQDLADLVSRAHAAGSRVVLTVNCFDQGALDQLTSSPTAPATLSTALVDAVTAKNLDGVNLDFEGEGSGDQAGLTHLVSTVSAALKAVNPHYQVTMDTYASSAADPNGFYDIPALAPAVDGFFVMEYSLNLEATPSAESPLTSTMFSDLTTVTQYTSVVPASKVILGVPYYGYDWPTSDGTLGAQATGGATPVAYSQITAAGHPTYWDPVTDTGWTSYQVGGQWHETFYEDPSSLYMEAQLAQFFHIAGLGIWALGFDGNDPAMLGALLGFAPAAKGTLAGPTATPPSVTQPSASTTTTAPAVPAAAPAGVPTNPGASTTTTAAPRPRPRRRPSPPVDHDHHRPHLLGHLAGPAPGPDPARPGPRRHPGVPRPADRLPDRRPGARLPLGRAVARGVAVPGHRGPRRGGRPRRRPTAPPPTWRSASPQPGAPPTRRGRRALPPRLPAVPTS